MIPFIAVCVFFLMFGYFVLVALMFADRKDRRIALKEVKNYQQLCRQHLTDVENIHECLKSDRRAA